MDSVVFVVIIPYRFDSCGERRCEGLVAVTLPRLNSPREISGWSDSSPARLENDPYFDDAILLSAE